MPQQNVKGRQLDGPGVRAAQALSRRMLAANPERLRHTSAVAARAVSLAEAVDEVDVNLLVAAAWVHDIGYSQTLRQTGFHPLDGARFLASLDWDPRLCGLVAHHSGSRFVAAAGGLGPALGEFVYVQDAVSDALTIADQTVGPNGRRLTLDERMRDMLERHGPQSAHARAHAQREAYFRATLHRVTARLEDREAGESRAPSGRPSRGGGPSVGARLLLPRGRRSS